MRVPIERLKATLGQLLADAHEQLTAFDQVSTSDLAHLLSLGANLWQAIERLDRLAILVIVYTTTSSGWDVTWQRWLVDQLVVLHDRAGRLLPRVSLADELQSRRLATRVSALDPLALYRNGLGIADVAEKLIAGPRFNELHYNHDRDVIEVMSLRNADLSLANLASTRLSCVDVQGANLNDAIATQAVLWHVNLSRASMRAMDLDGAVASHCDFGNTELVNARWDRGSALACSFDGADLMDMSAEQTTFMFCDFQGADLTTNRDVNATMTGAQFVKCDLRGSRWHNRSLEDVRFIECKLHGVKGAKFDGPLVKQPNLSPSGKDWTAGFLDLLASKALDEEAS
ncbi:MAG TPA: pentapeptide repeat-containing protein [Kofleriaceae bacterium]|nr:pentapeptide repeat-containing protein [Kofleriaceae bacterium]